ncbi:hypothetical protein CMV_013717 [Castanea mollissima]|uniref:Transmembrane protein n=1 Tax=Castanea mollissima TaxID=60419 RepID=A0A8J4QZ69_9ROSI|nr:hypothetical protein CMV_013717 [Castanea mollissima]
MPHHRASSISTAVTAVAVVGLSLYSPPVVDLNASHHQFKPRFTISKSPPVLFPPAENQTELSLRFLGCVAAFLLWALLHFLGCIAAAFFVACWVAAFFVDLL